MSALPRYLSENALIARLGLMRSTFIRRKPEILADAVDAVGRPLYLESRLDEIRKSLASTIGRPSAVAVAVEPEILA